MNGGGRNLKSVCLDLGIGQRTPWQSFEARRQRWLTLIARFHSEIVDGEPKDFAVHVASVDASRDRRVLAPAR
jgi:hypothetical protein